MKFLSKAICCFHCKNLPHMQHAISLSFVKLLWPLVTFILYSHDQDHVHVSTTCYASTLEGSKYPSIHKIKLHVDVWHLSHQKLHQGYGAMQKEINRCIPKEGMPHASACQKKREKEIKDAYRKKVCHMLQHVKKEREKIAPYLKERKREMVHIKEFIHYPPKISTHLHILIKVYDLFLLWIRFLT